MLNRYVNTWYVHEAHVSPTLSRSSATQCFEHGDGLKIHNRLDFYPGPPQTLTKVTHCAGCVSAKYQASSAVLG